MKTERFKEIANSALGYIADVVDDDEEILRVLRETVGLSEEEIEYFGFEII